MNFLLSFPLDDTSLVLPRFLTWYWEKQLLGIRWDITTQSDRLHQYCIIHDDDHLTIEYVSQYKCAQEFLYLLCREIASLPCKQKVIAVQSNYTKVAVQLDDGSILEYSTGVLS